MGIQTPNGLETAQTIVPANDTMEIYQPSAGGARKNKQISVEQFGKEVNNGGVYLNSSRKAFDELTSGTLSTSGWYTIAYCNTNTLEAAIADFTVSGKNGALSCNATYLGTSLAKTQDLTPIKLTSNAGIRNGSSRPRRFRLAAAAVAGAGAKLQVYEECTDSHTITVAKFQNSGKEPIPGWQLVTPYLDNTPTLPDGVTVGTFLEAGAEFDISVSGTPMLPNAIARKASNDSLEVSILWPEIPKQGTGLVITSPATALYFYDGAGNLGTLASHTISSFDIVGKLVKFTLAQTGIGSTFNIGPVFLRPFGTGGKFTIT